MNNCSHAATTTQSSFELIARPAVAVSAVLRLVIYLVICAVLWVTPVGEFCGGGRNDLSSAGSTKENHSCLESDPRIANDNVIYPLVPG